jgi:hypothetical protein
VFVQLRDGGYQDRAGLWDLFATFVHELLHLVTHPNYAAAADRIGGGARDVLIEGMDDHFCRQVWASVRPRIAGDAPLRQLVEAAFYTPVANAGDYAAGGAIDQRVYNHAYGSVAQADDIAAQVGEANVRAAYFMGHVEAIGIGVGTTGQTPVGTIGTWRPKGLGEPDIYVVRPGGESVGTIRTRTGAVVIRDAAGNTLVDDTLARAAGERLTIPALRWHTTIPEDTRAQVANQHGITQAALERANNLPRAVGQTRFPVGTVLLIPLV